ncbi:MAG TPA: hypothetical protein VHN14_12750 [Kofleriaceae bacterium]|jgi:hypothetical protein|nr:hypothetical protein [Kofleriaceae bacterium]
MAAEAFSAIEVIDLSYLAQVTGGADKQTQAVQAAIAQATSAMQDVAAAVAPKASGMTQMLIPALGSRRSGSGPTPAPALPPTSTLTR